MVFDSEKLAEKLPDEAAGFSFKMHDGWFTFEAWSPAGEDIVIEDDLVDVYRNPPKDEVDALRWIKGYVEEEYENFDVDEHVDIWAESRGERGVPETYRELVDDAEAIEDMLKALNEAVSKWEV